MLRPEVRHIFRTERPTNFKLGVQMEDEDPCHRDGPSPARSKVKIAMSRGASDVLAHKSRTKSPRNIKTGKYRCHEQYCAPVLRSKGQLLLRLKVYHIYRKEGLGTSKLVRRSSMCYSNCHGQL